jgi:hypothetical protein
MDLMSLVMETETARLRKSEPSRVHVFTLLYEEGLERAQVRKYRSLPRATLIMMCPLP